MRIKSMFNLNQLVDMQHEVHRAVMLSACLEILEACVTFGCPHKCVPNLT